MGVRGCVVVGPAAADHVARRDVVHRLGDDAFAIKRRVANEEYVSKPRSPVGRLLDQIVEEAFQRVGRDDPMVILIVDVLDVDQER